MNRYHVVLATFAAVFIILMATGRASSSRLEGAALQMPTQGMAEQPLSRLLDPYATEPAPTSFSGLSGWGQRVSELSLRAYLPLVVAGKGTPCFRWYGQIALQDAVNQNLCVEIQAGTWTTSVQISMKAGHTLTGQGTDATILRAVQPWIGNGQKPGTEAVVHNNGQPDVVIKNLTIDANNMATDGIGAHGRNMTVDSVRVTNARCDGIAIVTSGWTVQRSTIENNGFACETTGNPGAGIYIQRHDDDGYYRPRIVNNLIRNNGGPAIDVDRVWGGLISGNTLSGNWGWAAVSLFGSEWTVENNIIGHPLSANPEHFGHPECQVKRANNFSAGISICQSEGAEAFFAQNNTVLNNRVSAGHGIRLMGNDEINPAWTPRFNRIQGNDTTGATVGCLDDFEPGQSMAGQNTWLDNNCDGTPDSPPVYLWRLCPNSVSSATVAGWQIGVAPANIVQELIDEFNANREDDDGAFHAGDAVPPGALVATNFDPQGTGTISWENYPVQTVVRSGSWGLFRAIAAYTAPQPGACLLVFP